MKQVLSGFILLFLFACKNKQQNATIEAVSKDTVILKDSIRSTVQKDSTQKRGADDEDMSFSEIYDSYTGKYKDTIKLDTSYIENNKTVSIGFRHYCSFDSAVIVPEYYVGMYDLKEFKTHDFNSSLRVIVDSKTVIDTIITKKMFERVLPQKYRSYGVLQYPRVKCSDSAVVIHYSMVIPLTDIGAGAFIKVDFGGNINTWVKE